MFLDQFIQPPHGWMFLAGHFLGTNQMLHDQRSAGTYASRRASPYQVSSRNYDRYAAEVRRIRALVVKAAPRTGAWRQPALLAFVLLGYPKLDPSAWYLAGKAAEDGLRSAAVLASDRTGVLGTMGTVTHSEAESAEIWSWATGRPWIPKTCGMLVLWW